MKHKIITNSILGMLCLLSFSLVAKETPSGPKIGSYGICRSVTASEKASMIELNLNKDLSFTYKDITDPKHPLQLSGTYISKGNKVELIPNQAETSFHKNWKFEEEGKCITSRHKLNFRRICLL